MSGLRNTLKSLRKAWPRLVRSHVVHPLQAVVAYTAYGLMRALPLDLASALGGWVGRTLGPASAPRAGPTPICAW